MLIDEFRMAPEIPVLERKFLTGGIPLNTVFVRKLTDFVGDLWH